MGFVRLLLLTAFFGLGCARVIHDSDRPGNFNASSANRPPFLPFPHTGQTQAGLPRPADDALWNKCRIKGCTLLEGMWRPDEEAGQLLNPPRSSAQSVFKEFPEEIIKWGYQHHDIEAEGSEHAKLEEFWGITDALKGLGVNDKTKGNGGNNELVYYTHYDPHARDEKGPLRIWEQEYEVDTEDGKTQVYPYTGAYHLLALNVKDGVIMTMNLKSPKSAIDFYDMDIPSHKLPALSASSDIAFGMWSIVTEQNQADIKNINYFFSLMVTNDETLKVVARAMNGAKLEPYPGRKFWLADEDGKAIMGTPNGAGLGFFLMQHKAQLGRRAIFAVNVFHCSDKDKRLCLLFHVSPVEE